jgi:hypothetical protein
MDKPSDRSTRPIEERVGGSRLYLSQAKGLESTAKLSLAVFSRGREGPARALLAKFFALSVEESRRVLTHAFAVALASVAFLTISS